MGTSKKRRKIMAEILLAEDSPSVRDGVKTLLESDFHNVHAVSNGEDALALYRQCRPELMILDVMMPRVDGFHVCEWVRGRDSDTPVLFLTAKTMDEDKVNGFHLGCDDYVTKPFSGRELLARVTALLRRAKGAKESEEKDTSFAFCGGNVMPAEHAFVSECGEFIKISDCELRIINMLMKNENHVIKKSAMIFMLWGAYSTKSRTIDTHISNLRKKIDPHSKYIHTVYGVGYRYVGKCTCVV